MKRIIFSIVAIGAIALTSCKKDEVVSTELGTATINGTIRADIDQTNDVNSVGLYSAYSMPENVEGLTVKVEVNTQNWVQNPESGYNYDKKVYMATTDASGKFTLEIPATDEGYSVSITFEDMHGVTRKMFTNDGSTLEVDSYISRGSSNEYIYSGAVIDKVYDASITAENNSGNQFGSATIMGTVQAVYDINNGTLQPLNSTSPFPGKEVVTTWTTAPYNSASGTMSFTIDADGNYVAVIPTEMLTGNSVSVYLGMADFMGDLEYRNLSNTADSTWNVLYSLTNSPVGLVGNQYSYYHTFHTLTDGIIISGVDLNFQPQGTW